MKREASLVRIQPSGPNLYLRLVMEQMIIDLPNDEDQLIKHQEEIGELWQADPKCWHEIESGPGGGIVCTKCNGWFCF